MIKLKTLMSKIWQTRARKIGLLLIIISLFSVFFFNYFTGVRAAAIDVLNGTGSFDNTTQINSWTLVNTTGTSTWLLDTTNKVSGTAGSGLLQSPTGRNTSYKAYSSYKFTTTQLPVGNATLQYAYRKQWSGAQPGSGKWNVSIEIWKVGGASPLQTIIVDNGNANVAFTPITTNTNITAITEINTQYEVRLVVQGNTGLNSSAYTQTNFDEVKLDVTYDTTSPTVNSATVINDHTVNVEFNEALDPTSAQTISNYSISPSLNITGAVLQADGKTVQLTTATQAKGTNYTVDVNNVQDISGNTMATTGTVNFTGVDTTPPRVVSAAAVNGEIVNLVYNEAVDAATAENKANYSISPALTVNNAVLQADGKTVQLTTVTQTAGTNYTITVSNVSDTSANVIAGNNTATFTGIDRTPPTVTSNNVINDQTVDIVFNKSMDPATAQNTANYSISPALTVSSATLQPDNVTVRLVMNTQNKGTNYTITINNVKDAYGNYIASGTTTSFTGVDTTPPRVSSATSNSNTSVNVIFNEPVDTITAQTISNYNINPALSVSSAVLQADGVTVKLITASQNGSINYTVTVSNVKDMAGNTISANNTATFAGTAPDNSPPRVSSINVITNTKINVVFSKTVDAATAQNTANYSISPALAVSGATLQPDGVTVLLITGTHNVGSLYTVTVTNVKDTLGNVIGSTGNTGTFTGADGPVNPHANFTSSTEQCAACHNTHAANGTRLDVQSAQAELCYLCHDAAGQSIYNVADEFGYPTARTSHHKVPEGTQQCNNCHNPHGDKDPSGNQWPRLLQSSADNTQHGENQFCFSCHQNNQGGTKAISPNNYPAAGVGHNNVNYTVNGITPFNPPSGTKIGCIGCHQDHGSSLPKLLNSNPSNGATAATGNDKTFCINCHNTNSANNRYQGTTAFNNSKHSLTSSSNTNASYPGVTGQAGQCANCHDPHGTVNGTSLATMKTLRAPYTDIPLTPENRGNINYTVNNFAFCFQCHNSTSANSKYDIQTLYTDGTKTGGHYIKTSGGNLATGSKIPCEDCHSLHGSSNNNNYSLKDSLGSNLGNGRNECIACHTAGKVVEGLTMQALPTTVSQHSPDNTSACLACHGSAHQIVIPELSNPVSQGGSDCNSCHSNIVSKMSSTTSNFHHLIVNSSATYSTTQSGNNNCLSCHVDHNKFNSNKAFNLKANYTQTFPTSDSTTGQNTDFDTTDTTFGGICMSCHTSQQTKSYTQPDGSTTTPALSITGYANSAHNYNATSTFGDNTTFNANCSKCHNDSMSKDYQTSSDKFGTHDSNYKSILSPFASSTVGFCYKCHGTDNPNYGAGKDLFGIKTMNSSALTIQGETNKTYKHPVTSSNNHKADEGSSPGWNSSSNRHVECADCHSAHDAKQGNATPGSTTGAIGNANLGTWGIDVNLGTYTPGSGTIPAGFPTYVKVNNVTKQYQLCLKCHSSYSWDANGTKYVANSTGAPASATPWPGSIPDTQTPSVGSNGVGKQPDIAAQFHPANLAYHPLFTAGLNQPPAEYWTGKPGNKTSAPNTGLDNAFVDGWGTQSLVTCTDCHASDSAASPRGPHGSANKWIIKGLDPNVKINGSNAVNSEGYNSGYIAVRLNYCVNCHRADVYGFGSSQKVAPNTNYPTLGRFSHFSIFGSQCGAPDASVGSGEAGGNKIGTGCMNCHGSREQGGIHGTSLGVGVGGGTDARGKRFINGASWSSYTKLTTAGVTSCYTSKNGLQDTNLNSCAQHSNKSGIKANYDY